MNRPVIGCVARGQMGNPSCDFPRHISTSAAPGCHLSEGAGEGLRGPGPLHASPSAGQVEPFRMAAKRKQLSFGLGLHSLTARAAFGMPGAPQSARPDLSQPMAQHGNRRNARVAGNAREKKRTHTQTTRTNAGQGNAMNPHTPTPADELGKLTQDARNRVRCAISIGKGTTVLCSSQQDLDRVRLQLAELDAPARVKARIAPPERLRTTLGETR